MLGPHFNGKSKLCQLQFIAGDSARHRPLCFLFSYNCLIHQLLAPSWQKEVFKFATQAINKRYQVPAQDWLEWGSSRTQAHGTKVLGAKWACHIIRMWHIYHFIWKEWLLELHFPCKTIIQFLADKQINKRKQLCNYFDSGWTQRKARQIPFHEKER